MQNKGTVKQKQKFAREVLQLPKYESIPAADLPKWQRKYELLIAICEQISICEELCTPLSFEDVKRLCTKETVLQIENYCHKVKFAS